MSEIRVKWSTRALKELNSYYTGIALLSRYMNKGYNCTSAGSLTAHLYII